MPKGIAKKSYQEILGILIREGLKELKRPNIGLFVSSLSAGLEVSFSVLLMAVMVTLVDGVVPPAIEHILVANLYSLGFIFVILGRSELFTEHTTLAVLPVLNAKASVDNLIRLWAVVWLGNVIGAAAFAYFIAYIGPALGIVDTEAYHEIAYALVDHTWYIMIGSAVLAGWLMGLLSWLVAASHDTVGQIILVWLVTFSIGLAGLHHSIVGTAEVLSALFAHEAISVQQFFRFLVWTTIGNAIGGTIFVAIMKYRHAIVGSKS